MHNELPLPNVVTTINIGDFKLHVYAYRKLTKTEATEAAYRWLKSTHKKDFPKSGCGKVITTHGYID